MKNGWNHVKWVLIWKHSARAIQWIPKRQGLGSLQGFMSLGECSLSIWRAKLGGREGSLPVCLPLPSAAQQQREPATNVLNLGGGGESGLSGVKGQEGAPNSIPRRPPKPFKKTNGVLNDSVEKVPVKVVRSHFGFNFWCLVCFS